MKVLYFDGLFVRLDCGHRVFRHQHPEWFSEWGALPKPFDTEVICPICKCSPTTGDKEEHG